MTPFWVVSGAQILSGAAATRSEVDETPDCEDEGGGGFSPCNTEDDCFANCRTLDKYVAKWVLKVASVDRWWRLG